MDKKQIIYNRLIELNKENKLHSCKLDALAQDLADQLTEQGDLTVREVVEDICKDFGVEYDHEYEIGFVIDIQSGELISTIACKTITEITNKIRGNGE